MRSRGWNDSRLFELENDGSDVEKVRDGVQ